MVEKSESASQADMESVVFFLQVFQKVLLTLFVSSFFVIPFHMALHSPFLSCLEIAGVALERFYIEMDCIQMIL